MKNLSNTVLWMALALGAQGAMANTMMCRGGIIDDAQLEPATAAQVLAACGEPSTKEGGQWVYEHAGQFVKVLEFNSDGNLQSISQRLAAD